MAGYRVDWQASEPDAVIARWTRQEIREGRLTAGEDVEDDERCKKMCRAKIDMLRLDQPSIDRDALLALWLTRRGTMTIAAMRLRRPPTC